MENNIFGSVVAEPAVNPEANTALVLHIVILVVPITDNDVKDSGLNQ